VGRKRDFVIEGIHGMCISITGGKTGTDRLAGWLVGGLQVHKESSHHCKSSISTPYKTHKQSKPNSGNRRSFAPAQAKPERKAGGAIELSGAPVARTSLYP